MECIHVPNFKVMLLRCICGAAPSTNRPAVQQWKCTHALAPPTSCRLHHTQSHRHKHKAAIRGKTAEESGSRSVTCHVACVVCLGYLSVPWICEFFTVTTTYSTYGCKTLTQCYGQERQRDGVILTAGIPGAHSWAGEEAYQDRTHRVVLRGGGSTVCKVTYSTHASLPLAYLLT